MDSFECNLIYQYTESICGRTVMSESLCVKENVLKFWLFSLWPAGIMDK